MVARGAGAAGPVLLASRQWDPCGLAQRLPSLGAGAWRSAPLLPWRMQCPGRVCAALAACSGGSGRYLVCCLPHFPLDAPRVVRSVWRAVPPGCPSPSLAGTPFHAVCVFRGLGPVALLVYPACPLCVCALGGGRRPSPVSAPPGLGLCSPRGVGPRVQGVLAPKGWGGVGGGAGCAPYPPTVRLGGPVGRGWPASLCPPAFFGQTTKRVSLATLWRWRAWPPYCSGSCSLAVSGRGPRDPWRVGGGWLVLRGTCGSRRLGRGGGPCSGLPLGRRGPAWRKGGSSTLPQGGWGSAPPRLAGRSGGLRAQWGGVAPWPPCSLSRGAPCGSLPSPPFVAGAFPPGARVLLGSRGSPVRLVRAVAGGPAWRGGGGAGRPTKRPPRRLRQTQPLPLPSLRGQHCGRHWRCSDHRGRGLHTVLVRRRLPPPGVARASFWRAGAGSPAGRDPRGSRQCGARGRAACGFSCVSPRASRSLLGEQGRPSGPGGGGGPALPRPAGQGGGRGGERGDSGPRRCPPPSCPVGWPVAPSLSPFFSGAPPPWVYTCSRGCRAAVGAGRGPVGRQCGGGGGGDLLALVRPSAIPGPASEWVASFAPSWVPPFCCRSAAGNAGVFGRSTGGAWHAAALAAAAVSPPRVQRPPLGGCGASVSPARLCPLMGWGGGGGGPLVP